MNVWWRELRYATRGLAKRPGFALACVLTLALAIGANTAIFSVVNAVLLRPLPFKDPEGLVMLWQANSKQGVDHFAISIPYFGGWREQNRVFQQMSALAGQNFDLTGDPGPERISGKLVSANFFSLLGVQPAMGRIFLPEEDQPDHLKVAVVSYDLWKRRFGGVKFSNQVVTTNMGAYTVVGVMPADFQLLGPADIWVPLGERAESLHLPSNLPAQILASVTPLNVIARLKPGIALQEAQSNIDTVTQGLAKALASPWQARIVDLRTELIGNKTRRILLALLAAVGLVLLIACANVANLQLARLAGRHQEIATRIALGATRRRLAHQLLAESGTIAIAGAIVGLLVAFLAMRAFVASFLFGIPGMKTVSIDGHVLLFTLGISMLSVLLFGAIPGLRVSRTKLGGLSREGFSQMSQSVQMRRTQGIFVIAQVAFASVLLIGSMLTTKSLYRLSNIDLGFDPRNVLTFNVSLPQARYPNSQKQYAFFEEASKQFRTLPGVQQVGLVNFLPLTGMTWNWSISVEGRDVALNKTYPANYRVIDGDYFSAMQVPLLKGRFPVITNTNYAPNEVVINQAMAKQFWPNQDPIGQRIKM
ncbi:MAG TPA: ABC transporter permease [Candidatus Angelobacter sp.]|nr:ABC transporter permease [Candidatus Angelobacter sp.]